MISSNPSVFVQCQQVENSMKELKMILEILRNCLYQHNECKVRQIMFPVIII